MFNSDEFFVMGRSVGNGSAEASAGAAGGAFSIGGGADGSYLFDGRVDETRFVSFNPLVLGAFDPTGFLIGVPEPGGLALLAGVSLLMLRLRAR